MSYNKDWLGNLSTKLNGRLHSFDDKPALIDINGTQLWYKEGELHRDHFPGREDDLPAIIWANGDKFWYKEGKLHRDGDLPAIICANGCQHWYEEGELHRDIHFPDQEDDLPAMILANGDQRWYKEGKLHRDRDLPAIIHTSDNTLNRCGCGGFCGDENPLPTMFYGKYEWWVDGKIIKYCNNYNLPIKSARNI